MVEDVFNDNKDGFEQEMRQKIADLESQLNSLNPRNLAGLNAKEIRAAVRSNIFGDGSDGEVQLDGSTDFNDFSTRVSSTYTLTRDVFAENLTVNTSIILVTAGYRVFVKADLLNRGTIKNNGNAGNSAVPSSGGSNNRGGGGGGSGSPGGFIQIWANRLINEGSIEVKGGAGGNGANGVTTGGAGDSAGATGGAAAHTGGSLPDAQAGVSGGKGEGATGAAAGTAGATVTPSIGAAGVGGGGGGGPGGSGPAAGGAGGSITAAPKNLPRSPQSAYLLYDTQTPVQHKGSAGSGGGGGGGASGAGGGGGGGGGGGSGGVMMLIYGTASGSGTTDITGGTGGTAGGGTGSGANGSDGNVGTLVEIEIG